MKPGQSHRCCLQSADAGKRSPGSGRQKVGAGGAESGRWSPKERKVEGGGRRDRDKAEDRGRGREPEGRRWNKWQ